MFLLMLWAAADPFLFTDANKLGVEGRAWTTLTAPYDRLPAKAEKEVRSEVWSLSRRCRAVGLSLEANE